MLLLLFFSPSLPAIHKRLCFADFEIVVLPPTSSPLRLIIAGDQADEGGAISALDDGVGSLGEVMCEQEAQERAEQCDVMVPVCTAWRSVHEETQDPITEGCVEPEVSERDDELGRHNGTERFVLSVFQVSMGAKLIAFEGIAGDTGLTSNARKG